MIDVNFTSDKSFCEARQHLRSTRATPQHNGAQYHFSVQLNLTAFKHFEQAAFNVETKPVVLLGSGKGESESNLSSPKKVAMAEKKPTKF